MAKKSGKRNDAEVNELTATREKLRARLDKAEAATAKWKAKAKRLKAEVQQLTATVEQLGDHLQKTEVSAASWKAEAQRLETKKSKQAKQVKKLRKVRTRSHNDANRPETAAIGDALTAVPVPDESWTVTRLRASARQAGVVGYSRMAKAALLEALTQGSPPRD